MFQRKKHVCCFQEMKQGHILLALLWLSRGETLWRFITPETAVRHFLLLLFGDYNLPLLQLPLQSRNKVINNIWYFSDVLNKIPRYFANVRLLPELIWVWNVCFRLSGFTSPLSCLSSWKAGITFRFPLNHRAEPVTGANQPTLAEELTHGSGWCWITLPEKTKSWGFNSWAVFKILSCTLPERL